MQQGKLQESRNASIHRLHPTPQGMSFSFLIGNSTHIHAAYGAEAAEAARHHTAGLLTAFIGSAGIVTQGYGGTLHALIHDPLSLGPPFEWGPRRFVIAVSVMIAATPLVLDGLSIHLAVNGAWKAVGENLFEPWSAIGSPQLAPVPIGHDNQSWVARYRADMGDVARLFTLLRDDKLICAWQAIRSAANNANILYCEGLLRILGDNVSDAAPVRLIEAMERTGFVGFLDRHIVSHVVAELDADPSATLGVNISAQSAWLSDWWEEVIARLLVRRDIAHRLVIEITETAPLPPISQVVAFSDRMRQLGCRIAIDDFGVGHTAIRYLIALAPDIVKLDSFFLRRAEGADRERRALVHLTGLAGTIATTVIVEGVETQAQSRLAAEAGVDWQQGHLHGRSSFVRSRWETSHYEGKTQTGFKPPSFQADRRSLRNVKTDG